jgi:hypothetical protein
MADEAQITGSLMIAPSQTTSVRHAFSIQFQRDVASALFLTQIVDVLIEGTDIDLSAIPNPRLAWFANLDETNNVHFGIYDPETEVFYPIGELHAGEALPFPLSSRLSQEIGTGSGTIGPDTNRLRFKSENATCQVLVGVSDE